MRTLTSSRRPGSTSTPSPLPGPAGNLELFLRLRADAAPLDEAELQATLAEGAALPGAAT